MTSLYASRFATVSDLSPLTALPRLTSLRLQECREVWDISPLADCTALTSLTLWRCKNISNFSALAKLTRLRTLSLSQCEGLEDLLPLANLASLTSLDLHGCTRLENLGPLAGLSRLKLLDLGGCDRVTDLSALSQLHELRELRVPRHTTGDDLVTLLAELPRLASLTLQNCTLLSDLSAVATAPSLRELVVSTVGRRRVFGPTFQQLPVLCVQVRDDLVEGVDFALEQLDLIRERAVFLGKVVGLRSVVVTLVNGAVERLIEERLLVQGEFQIVDLGFELIDLAVKPYDVLLELFVFGGQLPDSLGLGANGSLLGGFFDDGGLLVGGWCVVLRP